MKLHDEVRYIRNRVNEGKSITNKQARLLVQERDFTMRMGMGFFNSLTTLRAFLDPTAPQWVIDQVKKDTDYNQCALESWEKRMFEYLKEKNAINKETERNFSTDSN